MTSALPPSPLLLEREAELADLLALLDAAAAGTGGCVLVEAAAGAGKSSLLTAAVAGADRAGLRVLRAAGAEYERDFPFGAIRQLLQPVLAGGERERVLAGAAAPAAALTESAAAPAEGGLLLHSAVYWLLANLAEREPLLIVVDDLHWVDDASLLTLHYLARRLADLPVALIGGLRRAEPGAQAEALAELRAAARLVAADALTPAAVAEFVRHARPDADDDACAAYHEVTGGNPLYLGQLLHATPGAAADAIRSAAVPTLDERVLHRIRRLGREASRLAEAIAVLGDGYPLALAAELAGLPADRAMALADALGHAEILLGSAEPTFVHPVIRHSVYAEAPPARRAVLHAAAADALERAGASSDAVVAHLGALPPAGSEAVAVRLVAAAEDALAHGAPGTAIRRLQRALAEGAGTPSRLELLFALGHAEALARDPACVGHIQEVLAAAAGDLRTRAAVLLCELLGAIGAWDAAWAAIDAAGDAEDPGLELAALRAILSVNDPRHAGGVAAQWDRLVELSREPRWGGHAIAAVLASDAAAHGRPAAEVRAHVEQALRDGRLLAGRGGGSWTTMQVLGALIYIDALDEANALADEIGEVGRRTGSLVATISAIGGSIWVANRRGRLPEAEADLQTMAEVALETGMALWLTTAGYLCQDVLAERPSLAGLVAQLESAELPRDFRAARGGAQLEEARGRIALGVGDLARARTHLEAAAVVYRPLRIGPTASAWRSMLALATADTDRAAAAELAAEEVALARAAFSRRALGVALRASGTIEGDRAALEQSLVELEGTQAMLERAYSHFELGRLHKRANAVLAAREHLGVAVDLAHRCGAERLRARATRELRATGARPRRIARTGRAALTPRELRIAELAAAGLSNPEVAQRLFLSVKTVEMHLTSAYAKLGFKGRGSRGALRAALDA